MAILVDHSDQCGQGCGLSATGWACHQDDALVVLGKLTENFRESQLFKSRYLFRYQAKDGFLAFALLVTVRSIASMIFSLEAKIDVEMLFQFTPLLFTEQGTNGILCILCAESRVLETNQLSMKANQRSRIDLEMEF